MVAADVRDADSLTIGLVGVVLSLVLGVVLGGISGYFGGWIGHGRSSA